MRNLRDKTNRMAWGVVRQHDGFKKTVTITVEVVLLKIMDSKLANIQFSFEEDETVTGIEDLKIANDESPVDDSPIYNLKGQRVNRANAQQKGVYIINGKKQIK